MRYKILIVILTLIIGINIVHAESKTTFSLKEGKITSDNEITVTLDINNNPEFGILALKIHYDTASLEYVNSKIKGLDNALLKGAEKTKNDAIALYAIALNKKKLIKDSGTILTMKFKIKDKVTEDIKLSLEITDYGVDENNLLEYETNDAIIKVKKENQSASNENSSDKKITDKIKEEIIKSDTQEEIKKNEKVESNEETNLPSESKIEKGTQKENQTNELNQKKTADEKKDNKDNHKKNNIWLALPILIVIIVIPLVSKK